MAASGVNASGFFLIMLNAKRLQVIKSICRNLGIDRSMPLYSDVVQFIRCTHPERLRRISVNFSQERKKSLVKPLHLQNDRDKALTTPRRIWNMVIAEYNSELRQYGFLYILLNLLEDTLRIAVDEHYTDLYGKNWHQNISLWASWLLQKQGYPSSNLSSNKFIEKQSFGALISFIYTNHAWGASNTQALFYNRQNRRTHTPLPNLCRCEVYEKLEILRNRRNSIYHHEPLVNPYPVPFEDPTIPSYCGSKGKNYNDGTTKNTVERIFEILRYFNLKPEMIMQRMLGFDDYFPHLWDLSKSSSPADVQDNM